MEKLAIVFPGGGTQYVGMGKVLHGRYAAVKEVFEEANDVLGYNLKKICFEGSLDKLSAMSHSQPAVFISSYAAYRAFEQETGMLPDFVAGHSLGEYTALTCAGRIRFEDGIRLVKRRGELLDAAGRTHDARMVAVNKIERTVLEEECRRINAAGGKLYVAVYNSPRQYVVSGVRADTEKLLTRLPALSAEASVLNIRTPSHCPLMLEAALQFRKELLTYKYDGALFPVISNVSGLPYTSADNLAAVLFDHMIKPVRWHETVQYLHKQGVGCLVDMGPQAVLKKLAEFIITGVRLYAYESDEDARSLREHLATRPETAMQPGYR